MAHSKFLSRRLRGAVGGAVGVGGILVYIIQLYLKPQHNTKCGVRVCTTYPNTTTSYHPTIGNPPTQYTVNSQRNGGGSHYNLQPTSRGPFMTISTTSPSTSMVCVNDFLPTVLWIMLRLIQGRGGGKVGIDGLMGRDGVERDMRGIRDGSETCSDGGRMEVGSRESWS